MPNESQMRLQDTFLSHLMAQKTPITVFLVNGIKLQGVITGFDNFCIALSRDGQMQTVYKQAISTIMPAVAVALWDEGGDAEAKPAARAPAPAAKRPAVVVERRTRRPPT